MDANEIQELFWDFETSNYERIIEKAGIEIGDEAIIDFLNQNSVVLLKKLMEKIEDGDLKYFCSLLSEKKDICFQLLEYTKGIKGLKELIEDEGKREKFTVREIKKLIVATGDVEYIKEILESQEKRKQLGIYQEYSGKVWEDNLRGLILATKDKDYIKKILEDKDLRKEYGLVGVHIEDMIVALNDSQYIMDILEDSGLRQKIGLISYSVARLLKETHNPDYIKKTIEKMSKNKQFKCTARNKDGKTIDGKAELIGLTNDFEYIKGILEDKEKIDEYGFKHLEIKELILATKPKYIIEILNDDEKIKEYGLDDNDIRQLILQTKEPKYIEQILSDEEKRKKLGLQDSYILELLIATQDVPYIKRLIEDTEERKKIGLDDKYIDSLVINTDDNYIQQYVEKMIDRSQINTNHRSKLNLPEGMTVGVEIESEGENYKLIKATKNLGVPRWSAKGDSSLTNGVEIVSPILTGNNEKATQEIRTVCEKLNGLGQIVTENCGGHIHIGADYLTTANSWDNLKDIIMNTEKILYIMSNKEGEIPREGICQYAKPLSGKMEEMMEQGEVQLETEDDLKKFVKKVQNNDRYFGINFMNLGSYKNTIEFRFPNGTLDADTWIENVNLLGGLVKTAEEIAQIQLKSEEERTQEEQDKLRLLEELKDENRTDEEKMEILLKMVVSKESIEIYRRRFEINSILIEQNVDMDKEISSQVAHRSIKKKNIGKKVFIGEDCITGQDYMYGNELIDRDMQASHEVELE